MRQWGCAGPAHKTCDTDVAPTTPVSHGNGTSLGRTSGPDHLPYLEGAYHLGPEDEDAGAQALGLQAAQGGFVELTFPEAGHYPVVSHIMVDAERGAHGFVRVTE